MNLVAKQPSRWFGVSLHALGFCLCALTVGAFYGLVHLPLADKSAEHTSRTEQVSQLMIGQESETADYRQLRRQLEVMQASVSELHRQMAADQSEESLLADLQSVAADSGLQVLRFQVGERQAFQTYSFTEVEFQCHGSYASICRFLEQAEQITKIAKLSNIDVQSRTNSVGYPIQLTFVLYSEGTSNDTRGGRVVL